MRLSLNCPFTLRDFRRILRLKTISMRSHIIIELAIRAALFLIYYYLENLEPFHRVIPHEQLWHYKYPYNSSSTIPTHILLIISVGLPSLFIIAFYWLNRDFTDLIQGLLGLLLTCALNGIIINIIKLLIGRPRPDYFNRCFIGGQITSDLQCNGDPDVVTEGRKSFPSGHSAWMFAAFGYLALYLAGKLQCFTQEGRSQSWRLLAILTPLIASLAVAISRIQDYRHHWEDVVVGGLIGLLMALCCYLHHYPSPLSDISMYPYSINNDPLSITNNASSSLTLMTNRSQQSSSRLQLTEIKTM